MIPGHIKLWRKIKDSFIWEDKPFSAGQAWIDLIMDANYKSKDVLFRQRVEHCERGQFITSILKLSNRWGWGRKKVRRWLELFRKEDMIRYNIKDKRFILITICNYEQYQKTKDCEGQDMDNKRTTEGTTNSPTEGTTKGTTENSSHGNTDNAFGGSSDSSGTTNSPTEGTTERPADGPERDITKEVNKERNKKKEYIYETFFKEEFWPIYPARQGIKKGKSVALVNLKKYVKIDELPMLKKATIAYSECKDTQNGIAISDAERFLKPKKIGNIFCDAPWRDWVEMDEPTSNNKHKMSEEETREATIRIAKEMKENERRLTNQVVPPLEDEPWYP